MSIHRAHAIQSRALNFSDSGTHLLQNRALTYFKAEHSSSEQPMGLPHDKMAAKAELHAVALKENCCREALLVATIVTVQASMFFNVLPCYSLSLQ